MKKNIWVPITTAVFLLGLGTIVALTDLFDPLIAFIHTGEITPLQGLFCIVIAILGFYLAFNVLVRLGAYFLPDD